MLKINHFLLFFLCVVFLVHGVCLAGAYQDTGGEDGAEFLDEDEAEPDASDDFESDGFELEDEFEDQELAETFDPLIGLNRCMFEVNDKLYFWILKPVAQGYAYVLAEPARKGVNRFFLNLTFPKRFVNNVLQLKFKNAGIEAARFGVNTIFGILGFWDPADKHMGLTMKEEDFGQTLGVYGLGEGFPLMIPIFGASNLRDGLALIPDALLSPLWFVPNSLYISIGMTAYDKTNYVSLHIGEYEAIKSDALDPYTFIRDGYAQNRRKRIEE